MACRIQKARFQAMADDEQRALGLLAVAVDHTDPIERFDLAEVEHQTAVLNRKAIQSLVDEADQARPIIRNLLRWAKEHGAR